VTVVDDGFPVLDCTGNVVVQVKDVNEALRMSDQVFALSEILETGKSIETHALGDENFGIRLNTIPMTMLSWDEDYTSNTKFSVRGGPFGISSCITCANGQIFLPGNVLDFETFPTYELTVTATNLGNPVRISTCKITIILENEDEPPTIESLKDQRFVLEDAVSGTVISGTPLKCSDPDANEVISWYIHGNGEVLSTTMNPCGPNAARTCNDWPKEYIAVMEPLTNQYEAFFVLTSAGSSNLDYETRTSFSILVKARDSSGLDTAGTVDISILDVNENPFFSSGLGNTTYFEGDSPAGHDVISWLKFAVHDPEGGSLTFDFECPTNYPCKSRNSPSSLFTPFDPNDVFKVDRYSGVISVKGPSTPIGGESFVLGIRVEDGNGGFCDSFDLNCGGSTSSIYLEAVANNVAPRVDDDTRYLDENSGDIEYTNVNLTGSTLYATVYLKKPVDKAFVPSTTVLVHGVPRYTIRYNKSNSSFYRHYSNGNLNSINGEMKTILSDPTPSDMFFSYITEDMAIGRYEGGSIGHMVVPSIKAWDGNLKCGDGQGICDAQCQHFPCIENELSPEQELFFKKVYVTPTWGNALFDVISVNSGNNPPSFGLVTTGNINFESSLSWDREFTVRIEVRDCRLCTNALSDTAEILVRVVDKKEPPQLEPCTRRVIENSLNGFFVGSPLPSTDPDAGDVEALSHSIDGPDTPFSITTSGQLRVSFGSSSGKSVPLDTETKNAFVFTATVRDSQMLFITSSVTVFVSNSNEPPQIQAPKEAFEVFENATIGTYVGLVNAFDQDFDSTLSFTIVDGDYLNQFATKNELLSPSNGIIITSSFMDYEVTQVYFLKVQVSDEEGATASTMVEVTVFDVNDVIVHSVEIIDYTYGMRSEMATNGGQILRLRGLNLGVIGNPSSVVKVLLSNAYISSAEASFTGFAVNCARIPSLSAPENTQVDCITPEGHGARHHLTVFIKRIDGFGAEWAHNIEETILASYSPPSIHNIIGGTQLSTAGGENITLVGVNFGPAIWGLKIDAEYGPQGLGLCASACHVALAHTKIVCTTSPGRGTYHRWTLWVGFSRVSPASVGTSSYAMAALTHIVSSANKLNTRGGEVVTLHGTNFDSENNFWHGCYSERNVPVPILKVFYSAVDKTPEIEYEAKSCTVVIRDITMECTSVPGFGSNHSWRIGLESRYSNWSMDKTSYEVPVILSVHGPGSYQASTAGGQEVYITGDFFGPRSPGIVSPYIVTKYGHYPAAWLPGEIFFPPYSPSCIVSIGHTQLTCITTPGVGKNHSWEILIAHQAPALPIFHGGTSYGPPIIYEIVNENGTPLSAANTEGGEFFIIKGNNFGLRNDLLPPTVIYKQHRGSEETRNTSSFSGRVCNVSVPHTEVKCFTMSGAGDSYLLEMKIAGQVSVVASTSYGLPKITSLVGPGVSSGNEDGNQTVDIIGFNFGPFGNQQFFQSVTYGEKGIEYKPNCVHRSHELIKCLTVPGSGANLLWKVTIFGQSNLLSPVGQSSYGPPNITGSIPATIVTNGGQTMQFVGSNFGISDSSNTPVKTFVDVELGGSVTRNHLHFTPTGLEKTYVKEYGVHVIAFVAPTLHCSSCGSTFSARVITESDSGAQLFSSWFSVPFKQPTIEHIYVTDGSSSTSRHLSVVGENFGAMGNVFIHLNDQLGDPLPQVTDGILPQSLTYVISYTHNEIHVEFHGYSGKLSVGRGGEFSETRQFEQLSPAILTHGDPSLGILYLKSDEIFSQEEMIYFDKFGHIPNKCRYIENEDNEDCNFFEPTYNHKIQDAAKPNVAGYPAVFHTQGYNNDTNLGHLIFKCKNCGSGFSSDGSIDLSIFIGPVSDGDDRKQCIPVSSSLYETGTGYLTIKCKMPPGENSTSPLQLKWGTGTSPPYTVSYRPPTVSKIRWSGNFSSQTFAPPLSFSESELCITGEERRGQCACKFSPGTCTVETGGPKCAWDYTLGFCGLAVFTDGEAITVTGSDFGSSLALISVYWGNTMVILDSIEFDSDSRHEKLHCHLPEGVQYLSEQLVMKVYDQSSNRTDGNILSKDFFLRNAPPEILSLDLGENTRTEGGYIISIHGLNFGRLFGHGIVFIGGGVASVISREHRVIHILAAAGQGKGQQIFVQINHETSKTFPSTFDYSPPSVSSLVCPPEFSHGLPTSGTYNNGSRVRVSLLGDNFGTGRDITIFFGEEDQGMIATDLIVQHTEVQFLVPPGEGQNLSVSIRVSNQTGTSKSIFSVQYLKPEIVSIYPANIDIGFPTSGCQKFEKYILAPAIGVVCKEPALIVVSGKNFGRPGKNVLEINDATGKSREASIRNSTHYEIIAELPQGVGATRAMVKGTGAKVGEFTLNSNSEWFNYESPILIGVVFGPTLETAIVTNTFDAQGGRKTNSRLFFLGEHFGEKETGLKIVIGGQLCSDPIHHGWSQVETLKHLWQNSGRPYLSCIPQETTVGEKIIELHVAQTSVRFSSPSSTSRSSSFVARCSKNFYGLFGERCVECWHYFRASKYARTLDGGKQKIFVSECSGDFQKNIGTEEPIAKSGFSLLPPRECFYGSCLVDGKALPDTVARIPGLCVPIPIEKVESNVVPILTTATNHNFNDDDEVQLTYGRNFVSTDVFGEQSLTYIVKRVSPVSLRLREKEIGKMPNLTSITSMAPLHIRSPHCKDALVPGEVCNPARYNGSIIKGETNAAWYRNKGYRKTCPFLMPCEPPQSCGPNSSCSFGYIDYYEPYRMVGGVKTCDPLHYTLITSPLSSRCFAPRCSLCDISEKNPHFRLDGVCVACPEIAWLLPAMMGFAALCALIGMLVLSRSKVSRHVLRIGVDYFQVLAMFRTAKVSWPLEIEFMLKYVQFFQMDIDLTAPECAFRSIVTYENKFFFKVALPFLGGGVLAVFFLIVSTFQCLQRCVQRCTTKRRAKSAIDHMTNDKVPATAIVTSMTMSLVYFLYLTVCRAAFDIVNCQDTLPPAGRMYMVAMPLEECYTPGGLQSRLLPYAIIVLLFYGLGFPFGIVILFLLKKKAILADQSLRVHDKGNDYASNRNYAFRRACGQMYSMFQPQYHMWAILMLFRKLLLCAVSVLFKENPTYQLAATLALMFVAFILQVKASPYLDAREKAKLMRVQAEKNILSEILRLERQSLLVRVQGQSFAELMHTMRAQIDEQDKIMAKHRNDIFNL
jgi:hypothetical protein